MGFLFILSMQPTIYTNINMPDAPGGHEAVIISVCGFFPWFH